MGTSFLSGIGRALNPTNIQNLWNPKRALATGASGGFIGLPGVIGQHSAIGRAISNDPAANAIGFENGKRQSQLDHPGQYGGAYAGVDPTLATAASGYQSPTAATQGAPASSGPPPTAGIAATSMPAPRSGGQVRPPGQPQQPQQAPPAPWMGGAPGTSMLGNYAAAAAAQRAQRNANPWSAALGGV